MARILHFHKGFTLTEIMLACVLMAFAFLPIMGVLSNSIAITEKDESTQRAVSLCQEKINMALQMPFSTIDPGSYGSNSNSIIKSPVGDLSLFLGSETKDGIEYRSVLDVATVTVKFNVPTCDFKKKADSPENPDAWFESLTYEVGNMVKKYTVTVRWRDIGSSKDKEYALSSLKSDIRK